VTAVGHGQLWWADLDKVRPVVVLTRRRDKLVEGRHQVPPALVTPILDEDHGSVGQIEVSGIRHL